MKKLCHNDKLTVVILDYPPLQGHQNGNNCRMTLKAPYNLTDKPGHLNMLRDGDRFPLHQYYVPNLKAKSKSRAASHAMEFLSRVFTSDGASRFFKTFLLRFLFNSGNTTSDDYSSTRLAF